MTKTPLSEKRKDPQSGKKERSGSAKKKQVAGQRTLAMAYQASSKAQDPSLQLEQPYSTFLIKAYAGTSNGTTGDHYQDRIKDKRKHVPAVDDLGVPGRPVRRVRRSYEEDDDSEQPLDKAAKLEQDKPLGDAEGYRYLYTLNEMIDHQTMPIPDQFAQVVAMIRNHGLHGRKDLSVQAFNLLKRVDRLHPSVRVSQGLEKLPILEVNSGTWTFTGCCENFQLDAFAMSPSDKRVTSFQVLDHFVSLMHSALFPPPATGKAATRGAALVSGDVLLFKWILHLFQQDLSCRLEVFAAHSGGKQADKARTLLQHSQLWRAFSDSSMSGLALDQKALIKKLMEIIAAPDNEEVQCPSSLEELNFNAARLSDMAGSLLRMLLELYGTAENAKMFLKHNIARASTVGVLDNVRMIIEDALLEGFAGSCQVLRTLPQKLTFIKTLHPKDQLRLLTMLIALKHAKRKGDQERYPSLEDFNRRKNEPGSVGAYLEANPLEALSYVLDDTTFAYNIIDRTADGLALLVSSICRAAALESSGSDLKAMGELLGKIVSALKENSGKTDGKHSLRDLSPKSLISLQAACFAIKAC